MQPLLAQVKMWLSQNRRFSFRSAPPQSGGSDGGFRKNPPTIQSIHLEFVGELGLIASILLYHFLLVLIGDASHWKENYAQLQTFFINAPVLMSFALGVYSIDTGSYCKSDGIRQFRNYKTSNSYWCIKEGYYMAN
jgi:hypothetical protein